MVAGRAYQDAPLDASGILTMRAASEPGKGDTTIDPNMPATIRADDHVGYPSWRVELALRHYLCCLTEGRSCRQLATDEAIEGGRGSPSDDRRLSGQLALVEVKADIDSAITALWPAARGIEWSAYPEQLIRNLPRELQAVWVVIMRGPGEADTNQFLAKPLSRVGNLPWRLVRTLFRRDDAAVKRDIQDAVERISARLGRVRRSARPSIELVCNPPLYHEWSWGGTPHPAALCACGTRTWASRHQGAGIIDRTK